MKKKLVVENQWGQGPFHMLYQKGKIQIQKTKYLKNIFKWVYKVIHKNFYRNISKIG